MKKYLFLPLMMLGLMAFSVQTNAQDDKSKRPSPAMESKAIIGGAVNVMINYSSPAVKGRTTAKSGAQAPTRQLPLKLAATSSSTECVCPPANTPYSPSPGKNPGR